VEVSSPRCLSLEPSSAGRCAFGSFDLTYGRKIDDAGPGAGSANLKGENNMAGMKFNSNTAANF
jgi:hypothetical protein